MHFHIQNLNEDRDGRISGSAARYGRARLYLSEGVTLRAEWNTLRRQAVAASVRVEADGEGTVLLHVGSPLVGLFLGLDSNRLARWLRPLRPDGKPDWGWGREASVRIFDWALWWNVWTPPNEWSSRTPKWRNGAWHPFGHVQSRVGDAEVLEQREVEVPMPEKTYRAKATRSRVVTRGTEWWPFSRPVRSTVTLEFSPPFDPVPIPGKGENSWDCGQDATYSQSGAAETIEKAIGDFVGSTLRWRKRHGGDGWRPETKLPWGTIPFDAESKDGIP